MTTPESAVPAAAELLAMVPYAATLGMTLEEATPDLVRGSVNGLPGDVPGPGHEAGRDDVGGHAGCGPTNR
jgi:hypothetical protein